jgi:hypothetical protein
VSRTIPLGGLEGRGRVTIVDDDTSLATDGWRGQVSNGGVYAVRDASDRGPKIYMHRLIVGLGAGDPQQVDHRNGDTLDNRRANLRVTSAALNRANSRKTRRATSSRYKGVTRRRDGRWLAKITVEYHQQYLGLYGTEDEAARAYDIAAQRAWGPFARLNFPEEDGCG